MRLCEINEHIILHFQEIMKAYENEIKGKIANGTVDDVMGLGRQIVFLSNFNPDEWEIDWLSVKEKENDTEAKKEE